MIKLVKSHRSERSQEARFFGTSGSTRRKGMERSLAAATSTSVFCGCSNMSEYRKKQLLSDGRVSVGSTEFELRSNDHPAVELNERTASRWFDSAATEALSHATTQGIGRGITLCGGGVKYLPCAWVAINILRHHGCNLPIELWHLGRAEMPAEFEKMVAPLGVQCVDALQIRDEHPARILNGWELKPYAIIHSRFAEVLSLDADNVAVKDPTFLFETAEYQKTGAIFWPDYLRLQPHRNIWRLTGWEYRDEPEFETGQILVNKRRCSAALKLTMLMNEYSDFWYKHIHGDKETFHMAWRKLGQPFAMPFTPIYPLTSTMCQHDFDGRRIFQHRNMQKWTLFDNPRIQGFELEDECLRFLSDARSRLSDMLGANPPPSDVANDLKGKCCEYQRVGYDLRTFVLDPDGTITVGAAGMEKSWTVVWEAGVRQLKIYGEAGLTVLLVERGSCTGIWEGRWQWFEKMPIVLRVL